MPSSEDPSKRRKHHHPSDSGRRDRSERGESRQRPAGNSQAPLKSGVPLRAIVIAVTVVIVLGGVIAVALVGFGGSEEESMDAFCGGLKDGRSNLTSLEVYSCRRLECKFDVSTCDVPCPFGYRVPNMGDICPESCECASKGITEGDVMFNDEVLPNMMENYGLTEPTQNDEVSLFTSTLGIDVGKWKREPGEKRIKIPYFLDDDKAPLDPKLGSLVLEAQKRFSEHTCIDFVPARRYVDATTPYDRKQVVFTNGLGCATYIGTSTGGDFPIYLSPMCNKIGVIQHEIMHMLGFHHEHCHPLRDDYIEVHMENVKPGMYENFMKMKKSGSYDLKVEYDKKSLMHYGGTAFAVRLRKPTIIDKATNRAITQQRVKFTESDIRKINTYYCPNSEHYIDFDGAIAATAPPTPDYGVQHWASWSLWTNCYLTCSATRPARHRYRTCQERTIHHGIQYRRGMCEGESREKEDCPELQPCDGKPPIPPTTRPPKPFPRPSRPGVGSTHTVGAYQSNFNSGKNVVVGSSGSMGAGGKPSVVNPGTGSAGVKPGVGAPTLGKEGSGLGDSSKTHNNAGYGNAARPAYGATRSGGLPAYGATGNAGRPAYGATGGTANTGSTGYGNTGSAGYGNTGTPGYGSTAQQPGVAAWTPWLQWTSCWQTCGTTTPVHRRYRTCKGTGCIGKPYEARKCPAVQPCSLGTTWEPWGPASKCTKNCGGGFQYRYRKCPQSAKCPGISYATRPCNRQPCFAGQNAGTGAVGGSCTCPSLASDAYIDQTNPSWGPFGPAERCSKSCGSGKQYRYRKCLLNGRPTTGCPGQSYALRSCNTQQCPGGFGDESSDEVFDLVSERVIQVCPTKTKNIWVFGNFNADKKIDVMCGEKEGGNMKMAVSTTGADFFLLDDMAPVEDCGTGKRLAADFDGDGADDILCKTSGEIQIKLMRKSGEFASGFDFSLSFCKSGEIKVLDFTGDGESDLLCWNKNKKSSSIALKQNKEFDFF